MIDRVALAERLGWSVAEVYRARDAWRRLEIRQPGSTLTFDEYVDLMRGSGLRPSMVGLRRGQYHLARIGDEGVYARGSCRFVPQEQNQAERREGYQRRPEFRALASEIARRRERRPCGTCGGVFTPGMLSRWHGERCRNDRRTYP